MEGTHYPDSDRQNNRLSNLRWNTHINNIHDRREHGTVGTKLNDKDVINIRERYRSGEKQVDLAKEYNVTVKTIHNTIHKLTWKHLP